MFLRHALICPMFLQEPLQRFYDRESRGFWQNMEMWSGCQGQEVPVFSKDGLSDIRMRKQHS